MQFGELVRKLLHSEGLSFVCLFVCLLKRQGQVTCLGFQVCWELDLGNLEVRKN